MKYTFEHSDPVAAGLDALTIVSSLPPEELYCATNKDAVAVVDFGALPTRDKLSALLTYGRDFMRPYLPRLLGDLAVARGRVWQHGPAAYQRFLDSSLDSMAELYTQQPSLLPPLEDVQQELAAHQQNAVAWAQMALNSKMIARFATLLNGTHELLNVLNAGAVAAVGYKPDQKNPRRGTVILALVDQTALARQQFHKAVYMHYVPFSTPPSQQAYNFLKGLPPSHNGFHVPEHPLHETLQPVFEAEKNMPLLLKL